MKAKHLFIIPILFGSLASRAEDQNLIGYESIVEELTSSSRSKASIKDYGPDPLASVEMHSGLGLTTTYVTINPEGGGVINGFLRGVEFNFGIDLLTSAWRAEGAVRSFQQSQLNDDTVASLREFDLKVAYYTAISSRVSAHFAGGMAARYLTFQSRLQDQLQRAEYSTPASLVSSGLKLSINRTISLGADFSYRTALINETVDKAAVHASLRLDAKF